MNWKFWQKKDKDNKVEEQQPIVIPKPINEVVEFRENIANHDKFNVLLDVDGTMLRIKHEQSHEIIRMVCKFYYRKIKTINVGESEILYYVHSISESSFVRRLFTTDNGNFFCQNIYSNDDVEYFKFNRYDIQKEMLILENPNMKEIHLSHSDGRLYGHYLIQPGTYARKKDALESEKYIYDTETFIDSYEIINHERYDQLIDVL